MCVKCHEFRLDYVIKTTQLVGHPSHYQHALLAQNSPDVENNDIRDITYVKDLLCAYIKVLGSESTNIRCSTQYSLLLPVSTCHKWVKERVLVFNMVAPLLIRCASPSRYPNPCSFCRDWIELDRNVSRT